MIETKGKISLAECFDRHQEWALKRTQKQKLTKREFSSSVDKITAINRKTEFSDKNVTSWDRKNQRIHSQNVNQMLVRLSDKDR